MKTYKELTEEIISEGHNRYPGDDMTMKELKIACNAAKNIIEMLEDGAELQRWQISAIVVASDELASVCTSMRVDHEEEMENDEMEMEYDEYGYPSMYGEEVELDEKLKASDDMGTWVKDFQDSDAPQFKGKSQKKRQNMAIAAKLSAMQNEEVELEEASASVYKDMPKAPGKMVSNRVQVKAFKDVNAMGAFLSKQNDNSWQDTGVAGLKSGKYKIDTVIKGGKPSKNFIKINEEFELDEKTDYKVSVDGLPDMYVKGKSPSEIKAGLRKIVKNPKSIRAIERLTPSDVKKTFRDKAAGKEEMEEAQIDKMKFISRGFSTRPAAERHNDSLVGKNKASHKSYVHNHEDGKFYVVDLK